MIDVRMKIRKDEWERWFSLGLTGFIDELFDCRNRT